MSRTSRREKLDARLDSLQQEFTKILVNELRACAGGHWGIFGQNDLSGHSSTAKVLLARAAEIERLRDEIGYTESFRLVQRYYEYRQMRGPNAPGEPKLAKLFLEELGLS